MTSWFSRFPKMNCPRLQSGCARSCKASPSWMSRWWSMSAPAPTGTRRTDAPQGPGPLLQSAEYFPDDAGARGERVLANALLLLADHEIEAVERLLCHVLVEVRLLFLDEAERRAFFGVLVVALRQADFLGRPLHDRQKAAVQLILGGPLEVFAARSLAAGEDALGVLHRHLAHRVDEQLPRLGNCGLGGAIH